MIAIKQRLDRIQSEITTLIDARLCNAGAAAGLRTARAGILVAIKELPCGCASGQACSFCMPAPTWSPRLDRCRCHDDSGSCDFCMNGGTAA